MLYELIQCPCGYLSAAGQCTVGTLSTHPPYPRKTADLLEKRMYACRYNVCACPAVLHGLQTHTPYKNDWAVLECIVQVCSSQ